MARVAVTELALFGPRCNEARTGCIVGECRTTPSNPLSLFDVAVSGLSVPSSARRAIRINGYIRVKHFLASGYNRAVGDMHV